MATPALKLQQPSDGSSAKAALGALLPQGDVLLRLIDKANLPLSLHIWAGDTSDPRLIYCNPALCRISGSTARDLVARDAINLAGIRPALSDMVAKGGDEIQFIRNLGPVVRGHPGAVTEILISILSRMPDGQFLLIRVADIVEAETPAIEAHISDVDQMALIDVSKALAASIENMLRTTDAADAGSSQYHSALMEFHEVLGSKPDMKTVTAAVSRISEHTSHLASEFQATRAQLAESSQNINDLRQTLVEAQRKGVTDELTSVGNRRHFDVEIDRTIAEAKASGITFCLLMADIDHFKSFNDEHGHQTGDMILRMIGRSLVAKVRESDIVARYGGEEFAIILTGAELAQARVIAENIRKDVAQRRFKKRISGESLGGVTISIGITEWSPGKTAEVTIEEADKALYAAKRAGRNRIATSTS